ncbi:DUF4214 domain-containing protein [Billgrantia azerbaijanica]|nr:DUF4214 domain-containing protein [Halomonas azerbaijanica]
MTRYVAGESADYPYGAVTYIEATFPDGTRVSGSGALIGINDVLTAAHLVYDPVLGGAAQSVRVYPGRDGGQLPYGGIDGAWLDYYDLRPETPGMLSQSESERDLALVGLDRPLGEQTGWFALGDYTPGDRYYTSGYPGRYSDSSGPRLVEDDGYAAYDRYYDLVDISMFDVNPGNSGGPVWFDAEGVPTLIGSVSTSLWATAVQAHYATLQEWMAGNDVLLPAVAEVDPADEALERFMSLLQQEGWSIPEGLEAEILATEPLLTFPDLESAIDPVLRLYTGMLGREPDQAGVEYWVAQLNAGKSLHELAGFFVDSREFQALIDDLGGGAAGAVEALYRNVLDRSADPEGLAYWLDELASGRLDLAGMALSFTNSAEYAAASDSLVQGAKLLLWGPNLEALDVASLGFDTQAFAEEQHQAETLVRLYSGILGREPDVEGFEYWLEQAAEEVPLPALAGGFLASDEFLASQPGVTDEQVVDHLYRQVLGRTADEAGRAYWLAELESGAFGLGDLALSFANSAEYVGVTQDQVDEYLLQHYDGGLVGVPTDIESYLLG